MTGPVRNIAASIIARLRSSATARGEDFNRTLQRYAAERFLYRVGASELRHGLALKGGMLIALWGAPHRSTRDVDLAALSGEWTRDPGDRLRRICAFRCPGDGIEYSGESLREEPIRARGEARGLRVRAEAALGTSRIVLRVDLGIGDAVVPPPKVRELPTLLDAPPPRVLVYPREAVIAEKLHAAVVLGDANTRFKDFHDLFVLASRFEYDGERLARSIVATFSARGTPLDSRAVPFEDGFFVDPARRIGWRRYLARDSLEARGAEFEKVGRTLRSFLLPPTRAIENGTTFGGRWPPSGPWVV